MSTSSNECKQHFYCFEFECLWKIENSREKFLMWDNDNFVNKITMYLLIYTYLDEYVMTPITNAITK